MPLEPGFSEKVISHNISEMEKAGHPHRQAVAAALHNAKDAAAGILLSAPSGKALFMKRSPASRDHANEWGFPFGSLEGTETPEQAAIRETAEETGITGLSVGDLTKLDEGAGYVTFRASAPDESEVTLNEEHTEYRWAALDDPPQPLHPGVAATLKKLAGGHALDRREYDANNWFEVLDNPLSKVGVYPYRESSIFKGGDRNKMVSVYRPAEELGSPACVDSFRLMPWTDDHPDALFGDKSQGYASTEDKGVRGVIGEKVYFKDGVLYGNLKVFSETLARKIAAGKKELSCGYHCDFVPAEGVYEGQPYQYVQKNMRGNHLSSVGAGRMGDEIRVMDAADPVYLTFACDLQETAMEPCKNCGRVHGAEADCMDADTQKFIGDARDSLVGQLVTKGYSKDFATRVAGAGAAEKGANGHDSKPTEGILMANEKDDGKKKDVVDTARDGMNEEEEASMDAAEEVKDAAEEKADKDKDDKEARDRKSARDRRGGARDARKSSRDKAKDARDRAAKDAKDAADAKAAKDAAEAAKGKGMDATEVTALVKREVAAATPDPKELVKTIRREESAKAALYGRVSPHIGAFDHAEMSHAEMAAYSLKKLGVAQEASDPVQALDFLLLGRSQAAPGAQQRRALDASALDGDSPVRKYLAA